VDKPMKTVAFLNQKGGIGKTSITMGIGEALAGLGHRVLLLDCDSQSNLAAHLGEYELQEGIEETLDGSRSLAELIFETGVENLYLAPATRRLKEMELRLISMPNRDARLAMALKRARKKGGFSFDFVLLDCPPNTGMITTNALYCARYVVIPTELSTLSVNGINDQFGAVHELQSAYEDLECDILGILINRLDWRQRTQTEHCLTLLAEAVKDDPGLLFETRIRTCEAIRHAQAAGQTVGAYSPSCAAAADYKSAAQELVRRIDAVTG